MCGTGTGYNSATKSDKTQKNSIKVKFGDPSKIDATSNLPTGTGSGLDSSSVTPGAFSVSGNTVESVIVAGNSVYLTLSDNLGSTERPSVGIASGVIKDKAGMLTAATGLTRPSTSWVRTLVCPRALT